MFRRVCLVCLLAVPFTAVRSVAQQQADAPARQPGELSAQQSIDFAQARQDFAAGKWAEAFATLQTLHAKHPRNAEVAKSAAEAAMNTGDLSFASAALRSVVDADGADWQALCLLARAYAEQHRDSERDAVLAKLTALHANTTDARFRQMTQFMVERAPTANGGHVDIYWSLTPYSIYRIYQFGRVIDANGKRTFLISLESSDVEQPGWAAKHPDLAAAGQRFYSLDGYRDEPRPDGQPATTQTHFTFGFFEDGRPSYDVVHARMVEIADGKAKPLSSRSGLPIPK